MTKLLRAAATLLAASIVWLGVASAQPLGQAFGTMPPQEYVQRFTVASATNMFTLPVGGYRSWTLQFSSVGSGNSITCETSLNNSDWAGQASRNFTNLVLDPNGSGSAFTISAGTIWGGDIYGSYLRCRVSTYGSGTVTGVVRLLGMPSPFQQTVLLANSGGSTQFGVVGINSIAPTASGSVSSATTLYTSGANAYEAFYWNYSSVGSGNIVTTETSQDNSTWVPVNCDDLASGGGTGGGAFHAPATGRLYMCRTGQNFFRLRVSTYGSGTVTMQGNFRTFPAGVTFVQDGTATTSPRGMPTALYDNGAATYVVAKGAENGFNRNQSGIQIVQLGAQCDDTSPTSIAENNTGLLRMACSTHALKIGADSNGQTDRSSTIGTGGTSQQVAAANGSRKYMMCQNIDTAIVEDMWLRIGSAAAANTAGNYRLAPGASIVWEGTWIPNDAINVVAATTGHRYTCTEG